MAQSSVLQYPPPPASELRSDLIETGTLQVRRISGSFTFFLSTPRPFLSHIFFLKVPYRASDRGAPFPLIFAPHPRGELLGRPGNHRHSWPATVLQAVHPVPPWFIPGIFPLQPLSCPVVTRRRPTSFRASWQPPPDEQRVNLNWSGQGGILSASRDSLFLWRFFFPPSPFFLLGDPLEAEYSPLQIIVVINTSFRVASNIILVLIPLSTLSSFLRLRARNEV